MSQLELVVMSTKITVAAGAAMLAAAALIASAVAQAQPAAAFPVCTAEPGRVP